MRALESLKHPHVKHYFSLTTQASLKYKGRVRKTKGKKQRAVVWGRAGGLVGGPNRAKVLSPARRREIAQMGAKARWGVVPQFEGKS